MKEDAMRKFAMVLAGLSCVGLVLLACQEPTSAPVTDVPQLAKVGGIPQYCSPYPYVLGADHMQSLTPSYPNYGDLMTETGYIDCVRVYQGVVGHCDYSMIWLYGDPRPQTQWYITYGCEEGGPN
jgi:hypothetical protein